MGWLSIFTGVDLDEEQRKQDEADAKLRELNQKDYGPGGSIYNKIASEQGVETANETYDTVQEHLNGSHIDVEAEVEQAFKDGLKEGYDNTTGAIKKTIAAPFNFTWAAIPWQLLAAGAVALFLYMGGHLWLKGIIKRLGK